MNEFTIEELKYLYEITDTMTDLYQEPRQAYSAKAKLKDIIDNYQVTCENFWPVNMINACPKCKRYHDE